MSSCAACFNNTSRYNRKSRKNEVLSEVPKKITFHRFPQDPIKRKAWADIMKLDPEKLNRFSVLCSNHFAESSIDRTSLAIVRLRENAVPLGHTLIRNDKMVHAKEISNNTMRNEVGNDDHSYNTKYITVPPLIQSVKVNEQLNMMPLRINNNVVKVMSTKPGILFKISPEMKAPPAPPIQYIIQSIQPTPSPPVVERVDRSTCVSPVRLFNSPEVLRVREAMQYAKEQYRKKIAMLQKKNRRLEKQVTDLTNLVQELHDKHLVT